MLEAIETLDNRLVSLMDGYAKISEHLNSTSNSYKTGDKNAKKEILSASNNNETNKNGLIYSNKSGYVFPFAEGIAAPITSSMGNRENPILGGSEDHRGTDIGVPVGTEIHSLSNGEVINAGSAQGYGQWVQIKQDDWNVVTYGHVSKTDFYNVGDRVNARDVVALSVNEGDCTGPHLHLQIEAEDGTLKNSEYYFEDCWPS